MKTTVKLDTMSALVIEPTRGGVQITVQVGRVPMRSVSLTPDQVGALLCAVELAAEAAGVRRDRAGML